MNGESVKRVAGDWLVSAGAAVGAVLLAATLVLTLLIQYNDRQLIQRIAHVEAQNQALIRQSNRNHSDSVIIEKDLQQFCVRFGITCVVVHSGSGTPPKKLSATTVPSIPKVSVPVPTIPGLPRVTNPSAPSTTTTTIPSKPTCARSSRA